MVHGYSSQGNDLRRLLTVHGVRGSLLAALVATLITPGCTLPLAGEIEHAPLEKRDGEGIDIQIWVCTYLVKAV
jgi:hypothetical protein